MKTLLYFSIAVVACLVYYGESRKFYCFKNNRCITVWKTFGNTSYLIPGKYFGLWTPSVYMKTSNTNNLTIYTTESLPSEFVYKSEQPVLIHQDEYEVFIEYNSNAVRFESILYKPNATKSNEVNDNVEMIDLLLHENFAIDKNGKKM